MSGARSVDVRFLRHPLACSWRSLSTCDTTTAVTFSLYIQERAARNRVLGGHCSWFSLSLCVSLSRRVSSLPALCFRLCRSFLSAFRLYRLSRSALDSAGGALLSSLLSTLLPESLVQRTYGYINWSESIDVLLLIRRARAGVL